MGTDIRPEISENNKYYLSKHRYYELLHFCRQYNDFKKKHRELSDLSLKAINYEIDKTNSKVDWTADIAIKLNKIENKIEMIDEAAVKADPLLTDYILMAVTKGTSYENLHSVHDIPCSRNTFYDRYRKFFWLLDGVKD